MVVVHVWIVLSVRDELPDHVVEGVWSDRDAALTHLGTRILEPHVIRCYMTHSVLDDPEAF